MLKSEETLLAELKSGSASAQHKFFENYWDEVQKICAKVLNNNADSVDIAMDVLTDFIYKYAHNLSNAKAMRSYIRLMAVRRSLNHKQKQAKLHELNTETQKDEKASDPEESAGLAILSRHLNDCVDKLSSKSRQAIRLKYRKDITNEEIGSILGFSKQYTGRLLSSSLKLLKDCLQKISRV